MAKARGARPKQHRVLYGHAEDRNAGEYRENWGNRLRKWMSDRYPIILRLNCVHGLKVDCGSTRQRTRYEQFHTHLYEANADLAVAASGGLTWVINITPAHIAISA